MVYPASILMRPVCPHGKILTFMCTLLYATVRGLPIASPD